MMSPSASVPDCSRGMLIVVSGPSGTGKSTLVQRLLQQQCFPISFSVSATSRAQRSGEVPGKDYIFLSRDEFQAMQARDEFLESAEVHGNFYGTPRKPVEEAIERGQWMLLEIDVQGHGQVKRIMPEAVSFFVRAASLEAYEDRLRSRQTESEQEISLRLQAVHEELASAVDYDFQIVNEDIDQAVRTWSMLLRGVAASRDC